MDSVICVQAVYKCESHQGQQKVPSKNLLFPIAQGGLTESGFVINHQGNTINGHITALVSWEASSHKAARGWRGFGGLKLKEIKSPDSCLQCIMGVPVTTHCETRH